MIKKKKPRVRADVLPRPIRLTTIQGLILTALVPEFEENPDTFVSRLEIKRRVTVILETHHNKPKTEPISILEKRPWMRDEIKEADDTMTNNFEYNNFVIETKTVEPSCQTLKRFNYIKSPNNSFMENIGEITDLLIGRGGNPDSYYKLTALGWRVLDYRNTLKDHVCDGNLRKLFNR